MEARLALVTVTNTKSKNSLTLTAPVGAGSLARVLWVRFLVSTSSQTIIDPFKHKSGSGEFSLIDEKKPEKVYLVVRTINTSAFSKSDWEEFVYEGPYHYNINSKPSWYHSRIYKATERFNCRYFVFTDYQRWLFGVFSEDHSHVQITPILSYNSTKPTITQALTYWARSAVESESGNGKGGYRAQVKDVSNKPSPYQQTAKKSAKNPGVSAHAESDVSVDKVLPLCPSLFTDFWPVYLVCRWKSKGKSFQTMFL